MVYKTCKGFVEFYTGLVEMGWRVARGFIKGVIEFLYKVYRGFIALLPGLEDIEEFSGGYLDG